MTIKVIKNGTRKTNKSTMQVYCVKAKVGTHAINLSTSLTQQAAKNLKSNVETLFNLANAQ